MMMPRTERADGSIPNNTTMQPSKCCRTTYLFEIPLSYGLSRSVAVSSVAWDGATREQTGRR
jgi:hypothetical protein